MTGIPDLKQQLLHSVLRGDESTADMLRAALRRRGQTAQNTLPGPANHRPGASIAIWIDEDGTIETLELTATPGARAWFDEHGDG